MITPARIDLVAQRRVPFVYTIAFEGLDFGTPNPVAQAASFIEGSMIMDLRLYPDAVGDPFIHLANVAGEADEGLSYTVTYTDGLPTTNVRICILQATLEATLPLIVAGAPTRKIGAPAVIYYDIKAKPLGHVKSLIAKGTFTIEGGVSYG